ncbi:hypothetical protein COU37_02530 [Candidatus Micrarchaeota archaeon CG10_big_fil_rev_8_21_14_0_10_45_29]|nr:MAG: hypothetical protein COU37_02530 [Candidatus Micrarchaeota archaeon CG10_big_fil_rev_8_21_14_0_10_45_29]
MRFTFLSPQKTKAPSFKADYDFVMFLMLSIAQILSLTMVAFFILTFYSKLDALILFPASLVYLALAIFVSYLSPQHAQGIIFFSILAIELMVLYNLTQEIVSELVPLDASAFSFLSNNVMLGFIVLDVLILTGIFWLNVSFPSHRPIGK